MITEFHPDSQRELRKPFPAGVIERSRQGMVHIGEAAKEAIALLRLEIEERTTAIRRRKLENVHIERALIRQSPDNQWHVYELCKKVYDLAEMDRVDFNGASFMEKVKFIHSLVPYAEPESLTQGVMEYHESRREQKWAMHYLTDAAGCEHEGRSLL